MAEKSRFSLFGFRIGKKEDPQVDTQQSFAPPTNDDGSLTISSSAFFGTAIDVDGSAKNEVELITRYREMALQPEVESAIEDIVNEAIVEDDDGVFTKIVMDDLKQPDKIKKAIEEEFNNIQRLLNYSNMAHDIFRRYYIDGRLFYHIIIDMNNPQKGIQELRYIDPRKIKKVREIKKKKDEITGVEVILGVNEYYLYNDKITQSSTSSTYGPIGIKISPDSIINVNSGLMDTRRSMILSYLHKCIKPLNQLRMVEDASVIYKLARAPQRRIFYIDVGSLPKIKAEQYVRDIMTKYKNKLVYDASTGEVRDDRKHLSMLEDFWMPRRCLSLNTKIKLLDGRDETLENLIKEYEEGKQNWTYSVSPDGSIVPGKVSWAGITRKNTSIVSVELDNGEFIECTPDHKFILRDGSLCEAQNLNENQSLMSLYTRGCNYNHKVVSVTLLQEKQDTGTLTIDENHEIHDYHNFVLSCGIFVKNSDGRSTEISTLESSDSFNDMSMVEYFEKKLYKSLNVPVTRLDPQQAFSIGRTSEITRDELKFSKFINKLRNKFAELFDNALRIQLVLKGICTDAEWIEFKEHVYFDFIKDNNFVELKEAELMQERLGLLAVIDPYVGKYYSQDWVRRNVLRLNDEEIEKMQAEISVENEQNMLEQQQQMMLQQQVNPDMQQDQGQDQVQQGSGEGISGAEQQNSLINPYNPYQQR